jgi:hypothetical protein
MGTHGEVWLAERAGPDGAWRAVLFQTTPAQYHGRPDLAGQHTAKIHREVDSGRGP